MQRTRAQSRASLRISVWAILTASGEIGERPFLLARVVVERRAKDDEQDDCENESFSDVGLDGLVRAFVRKRLGIRKF